MRKYLETSLFGRIFRATANAGAYIVHGRKSIVFIALSIPSWAALAEDVAGCGNLDNAYGPFNYVTQKSKLDIVERHHFTPQVERLIGGESSSIGGDLAYTLRAFPNHHRALQSLDRLELRKFRKNPHYGSGKGSAACRFKRAIVFAPNDPAVRILYGIHFAKREKNSEAEQQYLVAIQINEYMTDGYYNLGLLYFKQGKYENALENAKKAYNLGHPLPGLRNKLVESGHWQN